MRILRLPICLLLAASVLAGPAQATINGDYGFTQTVPFSAGLDPSRGLANVTLISGQMHFTDSAADGVFGFINTTGFELTGLTRVCWAGSATGCTTSPAGAIRITADTGSNLGFRLPRPAAVDLSTRQSVMFFVDLNRDITAGPVTLHLGPSIAAINLGSRIAIGPVLAIPATSELDFNPNDFAAVALLGGGLHVLGGDTVAPLLAGTSDVVKIQGDAPVVAPFQAGALIAPFAGAGARVQFAPGDARDVERQLNVAYLGDQVSRLQSAVQRSSVKAPDLKDLANLEQILGAPALSHMMNGATFSIPASNNAKQVIQGLTLTRFDSITAQRSGGAISMSGNGPLRVQGGHVSGAQGLLFFLPWWSWLFWIAAIGLWITRLVLRPAKHSERWDRLRWVGWIAAPVVSLVMFWFWDMEVQRIWGFSLLSGGASGAGLLFLVAVETGVGLIVYLAVVAPLVSISKSIFRFTGQGKFMGLPRPIGLLLGFVLGATLMLAYVDLALSVASNFVPG
jgi:hypothetical protein